MTLAQDLPTPRGEIPALAAREGDREIGERYLPLVRRIAMRVVRTLPSNLTIDDILSVGWVGLSEALSRRQPDMTEESFEAYASHRVRGAILDYLRTLDPLSRKLRGASRRITAAISALTQRLGRDPSEDEVAAELGLSLQAYQELLGEIGGAGLARLELPSIEPRSSEPSPEAVTLERDLLERVTEGIDALPERLRLVLALHYQEECTLREVGAVLGVTESRACQLHAEAVHILRARLETPAAPVRTRLK